MAYELNPEARRELDLLMAHLEQRWYNGDLWDGVDLDVVAADPVPDIIVWLSDEEGNLVKLLFACWTWEEAIRFARGTSIISERWTRVTVLS